MPEPTLKGKLTLSDAPFIRTLKSATAAAARFGSHVGSKLKAGFSSVGEHIKAAVMSPLSALAGIGATVLSASFFREGIKGALDLGGELIDLQAQTGGAIDQLLILRQVLEDNGVSADETRGVLNKMQRAVVAAAGGNRQAAAGFKDLGLSAESLLKMDPVKQFRTLAASIGKIEDPALRTAAAMKIFGKSGGSILGVLANAPSFEEAAASIGEQARVLKENAELFDSISDRLGRARLKLQGFFVGVAAKLAPALDAFTRKLDAIDLEKLGEKAGDMFLQVTNAVVAAMNFSALFKVMRTGLLATAAEFGNAMYDNLTAAFDKVFGRDHEKRDLFNAGQLRKEAENAKDEFLSVFLDVGKALGRGVEQEAKKAPKAPFSNSVLSMSGTGGLKSGGLPLGLGEFQSSSFQYANPLNRGSYNSGALLSAAERRKFTDAAVANGEARTGGESAFHVVRRGDAKRQQEVAKERERAKLGIDKSNELLAGIKRGSDTWVGGGED